MKLRTWRLLTVLVLISVGAAAPSTQPQATIERAKSDYLAAVEKAKDEFRKRIDAAIKQHTQAGDLDGALRLRTERDAFLQEQASGSAATGSLPPKVEEGWTILFRSSDPLLWNVDVQNADSYSVAVKNAPGDARYLRMRRVDTGEFVIIPVSANSLDRFQYSTPFSWRGEKRLNRQACVLGIVDARTPAKSPNYLAMTRDGNFSGWGFAVPEEGEERQSYVWNGQPIQKTVIEVAITSRTLRPEETRCLLGQ